MPIDCGFPPPLVGDVSGAIAGPDVDGYTATYTCDTSFTVHDEAIYECTDTGWVEVQACGSGTVMRIIKLNLFPVPVRYR